MKIEFNMKTIINFYREGDEYGYFSNFSKHPITIDGKDYATTEHYFQAMKFQGTKFEELVRIAKSASDAASEGRDRSKPLRKDWNEVKDEIMFKCVLAKFTQYDDLKSNLLKTKDALLVEHTRNDSYWGDGGDGTGKNMLGITLMKVRDVILKEMKE